MVASHTQAGLALRRFRWPRLRCRWRSICALLCLVPCGWLAVRAGIWAATAVNRDFAERMAIAQGQRDIVAALDRLPVRVVYDYQSGPNREPDKPYPGPMWQRILLGLDFVSDVVEVECWRGCLLPNMACVTDDDLKLVAELKKLKSFKSA